MATKLLNVMLRGEYCGKKATANFTRSKVHEHWQLSITLGDKRARFDLKDVDTKPCWTVAKQYLSGLRDNTPDIFEGHIGRKRITQLDPHVAPAPLKIVG